MEGKNIREEKNQELAIMFRKMPENNRNNIYMKLTNMLFNCL